MLREVRAAATEGADSAGGLAGLQGALQAETRVTPGPADAPEQTPSNVKAMTFFASEAGLEPEHWLPILKSRSVCCNNGRTTS